MQKIVGRINCKPFEKHHIEAIKKITFGNCLEEKEFVPDLPDDIEIWDVNFFLENGHGVVALNENQVVGYLCFFNPWSGAFDTEIMMIKFLMCEWRLR